MVAIALTKMVGGGNGEPDARSRPGVNFTFMVMTVDGIRAVYNDNDRKGKRHTVRVAMLYCTVPIGRGSGNDLEK